MIRQLVREEKSVSLALHALSDHEFQVEELVNYPKGKANQALKTQNTLQMSLQLTIDGGSLDGYSKPENNPKKEHVDFIT